MTNKERLINNNTRIQQCIDKANALPSTKGKPIVIEALDDNLLVEENIGKVYIHNNKLYQIINKPLESLEGMTVLVPQYWKTPTDLPEYYSIQNSFPYYVRMYDPSPEEVAFDYSMVIISIGYPGNDYPDVVYTDENGNTNPVVGTPYSDIPPCFCLKFDKLVEDYDYTNLIRWFIDNNARFNGKKYGIIFEEISEIGEPIEIESLDNNLLIAENEDKIYKCDNKYYKVICNPIPQITFDGLFIPNDYYVTVPAGWSVPAGYAIDFILMGTDVHFQMCLGAVYESGYPPTPTKNAISLIDGNTGDQTIYYPNEELTLNIRDVFNIPYNFESLHILQWLIDNNAIFEGEKVYSFVEYLAPEGTLKIIEDGEYNIREREKVNVDVSQVTINILRGEY